MCFQWFHSSKGHYDNVIRDYREMHISSWPESQVHGLTSVLDRLRALYPSPDIQTHLLHLSSSGEILPHTDNVYASGVWIMGVSLGATRMLRMASTNIAAPKMFDIMLPSGSVYLQR
jgi:alkylated DNA repair protein alkB family protein 7